MTPSVRKVIVNACVEATEPFAVGSKSPSKRCISEFDSGAATRAPPPNPMIAIPVARPGRSGNHLISVETGEM